MPGTARRLRSYTRPLHRRIHHLGCNMDSSALPPGLSRLQKWLRTSREQEIRYAFFSPAVLSPRACARSDCSARSMKYFTSSGSLLGDRLRECRKQARCFPNSSPSIPPFAVTGGQRSVQNVTQELRLVRITLRQCANACCRNAFGCPSFSFISHLEENPWHWKQAKPAT